jgi:hypothetical protein
VKGLIDITAPSRSRVARALGGRTLEFAYEEGERFESGMAVGLSRLLKESTSPTSTLFSGEVYLDGTQVDFQACGRRFCP